MTAPARVPREVERVYARWTEGVTLGRERYGRPLTYTEKVLINHRRERSVEEAVRGVSYTDFDPDRVALQDALAQIVALQFISAGLDEVAVPTTVHCDHLIQARVAAALDLRSAVAANAEVYDFLRTFCAKF